MKFILPLTILFCTALIANAQNTYDDLLELIVDEKYDRCLYKAVKYTEEEKTKKDPLPYVYVSMAYFRIFQSDDEKLKEKFEKPFKESVKYLSKFRKKDKDNEYFAEFQEFISEVRLETMAQAEVEVDQEKYTRSKGLYKYLVAIDENDPGAQLAMGHSLWMAKSKRDAEEALSTAKKLLSQNGVDQLQEDQMVLLKQSVIRLAEMFDAEGERSRAKEWLELTREYFEEDPEFNVTYEMIVG